MFADSKPILSNNRSTRMKRFQLSTYHACRFGIYFCYMFGNKSLAIHLLMVVGYFSAFFDSNLLRLIVDVDQVFVQANWRHVKRLLHLRQLHETAKCEVITH